MLPKSLLALSVATAIALTSSAFAHSAPACGQYTVKPFITADHNPASLTINNSTYDKNSDAFPEQLAVTSQSGDSCDWPVLHLKVNNSPAGIIDLNQASLHIPAPMKAGHNHLYIQVGGTSGSKPFNCTDGSLVKPTAVIGNDSLYFCSAGIS